MLDILHREFVYLWYYFELQLRQIFPYWVLGMVIGSVISVFGKQAIHSLFASIQNKRLGALGVIQASALGIASPLGGTSRPPGPGSCWASPCPPCSSGVCPLSWWQGCSAPSGGSGC